MFHHPAQCNPPCSDFWLLETILPIPKGVRFTWGVAMVFPPDSTLRGHSSWGLEKEHASLSIDQLSISRPKYLTCTNWRKIPLGSGLQKLQSMVSWLQHRASEQKIMAEESVLPHDSQKAEWEGKARGTGRVQDREGIFQRHALSSSKWVHLLTAHSAISSLMGWLSLRSTVPHVTITSLGFTSEHCCIGDKGLNTWVHGEYFILIPQEPKLDLKALMSLYSFSDCKSRSYWWYIHMVGGQKVS